MAYLEGSSVKDRLNSAYVPGLTKNFMVWPWVQFVNFKYVPADLRVLVVNVISLGWNCYLSFLNSGGGSKVESVTQAVREKTREGGSRRAASYRRSRFLGDRFERAKHWHVSAWSVGTLWDSSL